MECVTSASYRLMINGKRFEVIKPGRGLKWGDPLSPYLFIFVSDVLSRLVTDVVAKKDISPLRMTRSYPALSHMFFVDDSLFFLEATERNIMRIKNIIEAYCRANGQAVNY